MLTASSIVMFFTCVFRRVRDFRRKHPVGSARIFGFTTGIIVGLCICSVRGCTQHLETEKRVERDCTSGKGTSEGFVGRQYQLEERERKALETEKDIDDYFSDLSRRTTRNNSNN